MGVVLTGWNVTGNAGRSAQAGLVRRQEISYFYHPKCPKCAKAKPLVEGYASQHRDLPLREYNIGEQKVVELRRAYDAAYNVPRWKQLGIPAVFLQDRAYLGLGDVERLAAGAPPRPLSKAPPSRLQLLGESYAPPALRALIVLALLTAAVVLRLRNAAALARLGLAISLFLAAVLIAAGAWKAMHAGDVADLLRETWGLDSWPFVGIWLGVWAVIGAEAVVALLLLSGRPRGLAPWAVLAIYGVFLLYSVLAHVLAVSGDCGCFPWAEYLGWSTIGRNAGFVMLAYVLLDSARRSRLGTRRSPSSSP
jgi:thiol-disulfide isomerase/thioredoxin